MKTIEEKAKAYDEAIKRAAIAYKDEDRHQKATLERIFPELKESMDEKVRKAIKYAVSQLTDICLQERYSVKQNDCIAWLEKQVEKKSYASETMNEKGDFDNGFTRMMEKEQKPADKVEPEFNIDDWIVYDHRPYQVVELPKEGYINLGLRGNGKIEFAPSTYCRHWTIQDAKPGDVLNSVRVQATIIFKGWADDGKHILAYCALQKGIFIKQEMLWDRDFEPCPKYWYDELFQKMKEAGYEWDAKKKELKKIEQKPQRMVSAEAKEALLEEKPAGCPEHCVMSNCGNCPSQPVLIKQKPAEWSEEDKKMLESALWHVKNSCSNGGKNSGEFKVYNWLKSFKDRCITKPHWKPSKSEISILEDIISGKCNSKDYQATLLNILEQLKKL